MTGKKKPWRWAAGAGVLLLFVSLFLIRLGILQALLGREERPSAPIRGTGATGETWMTIYQKGQKIGYAERRLQATDLGYRFYEHLFLQVNTLGMVQPITVLTEAELNPDRSLDGFRFELASNLFRFRARGEAKDGQLTVHIGNEGEERISVIPLSEPLFLGGGILDSAGIAGLKSGEGKTFSVFDPASLGQRPVKVTFLGEEAVRVMGIERPAKKLSVDFLGMKQFAWVDASGHVVREEGMLGMSMEQTTRQEALSGIAGKGSADLTAIASILPTRPIDDPDSLQVLMVRPGGFAEGSFFLDGGRQAYRQGVLTIRRETRAPSPASAGVAADLSAFLKATPFIQSDHPKILQKVAEIVQPGDPEGVKADRLLAWVHQNLEKSPVLSVPNALETLQHLKGDCNEHAVLLAALARAVGIPAEVEAGVVYLRGRFFYHAWNVLYLKERGGWVTADATFGQMPADVTHIRFIRGSGERQLDLAGLIGRLTLEILEMKR